MMVGAGRGDIDGMVLWDPVVHGKAYLEELTALHKGMLGYAHVQSKRSSTNKQYTEILGFPLPNFMVSDIENIDLLAIQQKPANIILTIESNEKAHQVQLSEHLQGIGANVEYKPMPSPELWVWEEAFNVRVPHQILQLVVSWLSEVYP